MRMTIAVAAALLMTIWTGSVIAAPPADEDACNKLAFSLAEKAANKKLPEAEAVKIDEMIVRLEAQCGEGKFTDAEATAKEIEAALAK